MVDILNLKFNDESRSGSSPDERTYHPTTRHPLGCETMGVKVKERKDKRKGRKKNKRLRIK